MLSSHTDRERSRSLRCLRGALAFVWLFGCEPDPPDAAAARAFHDAHATDLQAFETSIQDAVRAIPWFEVAEPPCETPPTSEGNALETRMDILRCTQSRLERMEQRDEAISELERAVIPPLLREVGALSARLTYQRGGGEGLYHLGAIEPAPPTAREGAVRAQHGVRASTHNLGWGLFASGFTDAEGVPHGNETFVRGYEIAFHFEVGDAQVSVSLFFLER